MLLNIHHHTHYRYQVPASYSLQTLLLWPRTDGGQRIRHWRLELPGRRWVQQDAYGNTLHIASLVEKHAEIDIVASGQVETPDERGLLIPHDSRVPAMVFSQPTALTAADLAITQLSRQLLGSPDDSAICDQSLLEALCECVHDTITFTQGVTDVSATAAEVLAHKQGVCQDMTHVFLALCRARGIAARYVSGYLLTDATHAASHAWAEVWMPDALRGHGGWLGFDVTHNRLAGPELCRLAVGRDYADTCPMRGIHMGGMGESMQVQVAVRDGLDMMSDQ
jgi:transglutaminase-like putative cysteine protease